MVLCVNKDSRPRDVMLLMYIAEPTLQARPARPPRETHSPHSARSAATTDLAAYSGFKSAAVQ